MGTLSLRPNPLDELPHVARPREPKVGRRVDVAHHRLGAVRALRAQRPPAHADDAVRVGTGAEHVGDARRVVVPHRRHAEHRVGRGGRGRGVVFSVRHRSCSFTGGDPRPGAVVSVRASSMWGGGDAAAPAACVQIPVGRTRFQPFPRVPAVTSAGAAGGALRGAPVRPGRRRRCATRSRGRWARRPCAPSTRAAARASRRRDTPAPRPRPMTPTRR